MVFGDEMILGRDIEDWPLCDALLSWHSEGFPLEKAGPIPMLPILASITGSVARRPLGPTARK